MILSCTILITAIKTKKIADMAVAFPYDFSTKALLMILWDTIVVAVPGPPLVSANGRSYSFMELRRSSSTLVVIAGASSGNVI